MWCVLISLHRPGAIGDVIMTLNLIPLLKAKHPNEDIAYYCHPGIGQALWPIMRDAGVTFCHASEQYAHYRDPAHSFNLIGYPLHEGYPEKPMRQHLIRYFAEEMGVELGEELPSLDLEMPLTQCKLPLHGYATIHVQAGWSAYKNWILSRWNEVIKALPEIEFVQIGGVLDPKLDVEYQLMGHCLNDAIAAIAHGRLHIGIDSFSNHVTHFTWNGKGKTPAVILWGSTQASAAGYEHNTNISLGLSCQPCFREDPKISRMSRGPCINPPGQVYERPMHACMSGITVEQVVEAIREKWRANA